MDASDRCHDPEIQSLLSQRNDLLSDFFFATPSTLVPQTSTGQHILLINNEDDFVFMLAHMIRHR